MSLRWLRGLGCRRGLAADVSLHNIGYRKSGPGATQPGRHRARPARSRAPRRPSAYLLNLVGTVQLPSGGFKPPLRQATLPEVGVFRPHTHEPLGSVEGALNPHPSGPLGPLDIDTSDIEPSALDRVLKARPRQFQTQELAQVRGFAYKWLLMQRGQQHAHPPDEHVCARLIAAAGGPARLTPWRWIWRWRKPSIRCGLIASRLPRGRQQQFCRGARRSGQTCWRLGQTCWRPVRSAAVCR